MLDIILFTICGGAVNRKKKKILLQLMARSKIISNRYKGMQPLKIKIILFAWITI
jgi:hypothetical protein